MYNCKVCGKEFVFSDPNLVDRIKKQRLKAHVTRCQKVEKFQCKHCGKVYDDEEMPNFQKRQSLSRHEKTCKGFVKFQCEHCGKENDDQDIPIHEKRKRMRRHEEICGNQKHAKELVQFLIDNDDRTRKPHEEEEHKLSVDRAVTLMVSSEEFASEWRKIILIEQPSDIRHSKFVMIFEHGLPRLLVTPKNHHGKISRAKIANDYKNIFFTNSNNQFYGVTLDFIMKIGGAYLEDFNLYSCRRDLATMFRDTYVTYMKRFSGFHSSDFHWSLGALPCETTFQTFIEIFYDLLQPLFKKMCEENYIVDGDLLRIDCSIKPALRTQNFRNLAACLGRSGRLLKCQLIEGNESGVEYQNMLRDILMLRKEKCDVSNAIPDFIFDNSEIGEKSMISLVKEVFHEQTYEEQIENVFIGGCPVHPVMKLVETNGENCVNSTHKDAALLVKCFRIHQRRFSHLEKKDTQIFIEKIKKVCEQIPPFYYSHLSQSVKLAKQHPLFNLTSEIVHEYDPSFKNAFYFDANEHSIIDNFLMNGKVDKLTIEFKKKLLQYHNVAYKYKVPVWDVDKISGRVIIVNRRDTMLPSGIVAILLGYKVKTANKLHSPKTSFGGFRSITEIAQEICRLLLFFEKPVCGTRLLHEKYTKSPQFIDDEKTPKSISTVLTSKVKTLFIRMLFRVNLKGFLNHLCIMNKVWLRHEKPVAISTTNVEQFFSEFNRATNRLQMQNNITNKYAQMLTGLFHFRRLSLEKLTHGKSERRPMNTQRNHIIESSMDLWHMIEHERKQFEDTWKKICENQLMKIENTAQTHTNNFES